MSVLSRNLRASSGKNTVTTDPYFINTTLLLQGEGTNGGQNNTFIDNSSNNFTITRTGTTTQGSFNPYGDRWSNYFDGTGDYFTIPTNTAFQLTNTTAFTLEAWAYRSTTATGKTIFSAYNPASPYAGYGLGIGGDNVTNQLQFWDGTVWRSFGAIPVNAWTHVAVCSDGANCRVFINGVQGGSTFTPGSNISYTAGSIFIGAQPQALYNWQGYLSNVRLVKGTALYTSAFTPSTTTSTVISGTSLLTCQSNRFKDSSANNFTLTKNGDVKVTPFSPYAPSKAYSPTTGASIYFDKSVSSLSIPSNSAFTMGTGDFTVEAWIYCPVDLSLDSANTIIRQSLNGSLAWDLQMQTGYMYFCYGANVILDPIVVTTGTWIHYAAVVNSGTITLYRNGIPVTTPIAAAFNFSATAAVLVGIGGDSSDTVWPFAGYISDARVVKGTAVYTTTFTPPTQALTAITNTSLLLKYNNASMYDSTSNNNLQTVGNAQISTSVKKYDTGSIYFDGTGDYLSTPYSDAMDLLPTSFTVEGWVYPTVFRSSGMRIFATGGGVVAWSATTGIHVLCQILLAGTINMQLSTNSATPAQITSTQALSLNTWSHIAFVYDNASGVIRLFVNGVMTSGSVTGVAKPSTNPTMNIASIPGELGSATYAFQGYIDDLRVTKTVRYSAAFTPPTSALPNR